MPIYRPDPKRFARCVSLMLMSFAATHGALATPHHPRRSPARVSVTKPVAVAAAVAVTAAETASPNADAVGDFLVDKGIATPQATPSVSESPFVDRMRDRASDMVLTAMNFLGVPYRAGGSSADRGFDCSGFTRHIFELSIGRVLPRRADEQATTAGLMRIGREELRPGDLVFFNTMRRTFSHVGIYLGEGKFIHSPKPGGEVRVDDMRTTYWDQRFTGGRREQTLLPKASSGSAERLVRVLN